MQNCLLHRLSLTTGNSKNVFFEIYSKFHHIECQLLVTFFTIVVVFYICVHIKCMNIFRSCLCMKMYFPHSWSCYVYFNIYISISTIFSYKICRSLYSIYATLYKYITFFGWCANMKTTSQTIELSTFSWIKCLFVVAFTAAAAQTHTHILTRTSKYWNKCYHYYTIQYHYIQYMYMKYNYDKVAI